MAKQFTVADFFKRFPTDDACLDHLMELRFGLELDCPKCGKPTRIVKRVKDRERGTPGGIFISCSACEFFEKL